MKIEKYNELREKILSFELDNVLPDDIVSMFAEYWCESEPVRHENLGEFIQRVAQYAIASQPVHATDKQHLREMDKKQDFKELVLQKEKEGKVVFMTCEGPLSTDLEVFIKQHTEGLLYDLNRDRVTVLTSIDDPKWVNDFAVGLVIAKLKEYYDRENRI